MLFRSQSTVLNQEQSRVDEVGIAVAGSSSEIIEGKGLPLNQKASLKAREKPVWKENESIIMSRNVSI